MLLEETATENHTASIGPHFITLLALRELFICSDSDKKKKKKEKILDSTLKFGQIT